MVKTDVSRNVGIAGSITANPASGALLPGPGHLPGLAVAESIRAAYEISTVAACRPDFTIGRDTITFG